MRSLRILVVEDDKEIRSVLSTFLEIQGHVVLAVESGTEAIEVMSKAKPDLVISDFNLGDKNFNGHDVLAKAKQMHPTACLAMMTAFSEVDMAVKAMKIGAIEFIKKPFDLSRIDELLNQVIKIKESVKNLDSLEKDHIMAVLSDSKTYEEAADTLGINMATLWRKRKAYDLQAKRG
jgi:DNA-binding NtrC family response regulator